MNNKSTKTMYYMFTLTFIWLTVLTISTVSKLNTEMSYRVASDMAIGETFNRVIRLETRLVEETIARKEAMTSFQDAFKLNREVYGSDAVFNWNGEMYTTSYKEETNNN
tara:strand:- start:637 stop:963 length:327 start_codon:yes stop_codon:yes gene_type:complete